MLERAFLASKGGIRASYSWMPTAICCLGQCSPRGGEDAAMAWKGFDIR